MIDETEITLCEPAPFLFHENGQIAVTDGSTVWLVIVTCEAIKATAENSSTADPVCRVLPRPGCSRDRQGEDVDGKVWVTEATVMSSKPRAMNLPSGLGGRLARHGS